LIRRQSRSQNELGFARGRLRSVQVICAPLVAEDEIRENPASFSKGERGRVRTREMSPPWRADRRRNYPSRPIISR